MKINHQIITTTMEQKITYLSRNILALSNKNPRKIFDEEGLKELSNSIKEVGMLSPIIVRPDGDGYEIICGARRFKAACMTEYMEVPCIIRELDDDQAMDLMITENLQRQDVSPIEEARAFKSLIELRGYTVQGLIDRFAKSEKYIRYRIKLNDLIPEFVDQLSKEMITLGHANELCKLDPSIQKEIFNERFSEKKQYYGETNVSSLKSLIKSHYTLDLSDAPFSTKDATLDKKAGPCITCSFNSATNTLLFPDMPTKGVCLNKPCFKNKSEIDFERKLKKVMEEEPSTIIGCRYAYGDDEKWIKEQKKKKDGVPVFEIDYESGFVSLDKAVYDPNDPTHVKVFRVDNSSKGKFEYYKRTKGDDSSVESVTLQSQIDELRIKDARNKELSFEKVYLKAKELLKANGYSDLNTDLTPAEYIALYVIMMDAANDDLRKELNVTGGYYIESKTKLPAAQKITPEQVVRLTRSFIQSKLANTSPNYNISESKVTINLCKAFFPEEISAFELEQEGKYLNRKKKIDERIAELQAQAPVKKESKKGKKTSQEA
jgi:ParB family chromosome partitioning protein